MSLAMSREQISDFLKQRWIGRLATVRKSGKPHIAPVWFEFNGSAFYITASRDTVKIRNIIENPDVAMSIDTNEPPHKGVIVEGRAEITEFDAWKWTLSGAAKYMGKDDAEKHATELLKLGHRVVIKIIPEKILSWDYSKIRT